MGRKPKPEDQRLSERFEVRLSRADRARIEEAVPRDEWSAFVRKVVMAAVDRLLKKQRKPKNDK